MLARAARAEKEAEKLQIGSAARGVDLMQKINHDVHLSDYHMSDSEKELFCTTDKCVVE